MTPEVFEGAKRISVDTAKISEHMKKMWADPAMKAKIMASRNTPEAKAKFAI